MLVAFRECRVRGLGRRPSHQRVSNLDLGFFGDTTELRLDSITMDSFEFTSPIDQPESVGGLK